MKMRFATLTALVTFCAVASLHAQSGCTDSPENPTAILGLVGAGGWWAASSRHRVAALVHRLLQKDK
jgi:XrtJ-associated TM-motif-TM protein